MPSMTKDIWILGIYFVLKAKKCHKDVFTATFCRVRYFQGRLLERLKFSLVQLCVKSWRMEG